MCKDLFNKILSYSLLKRPVALSQSEYSVLLDMYLNDKNSSTLREEITLMVSNVFSVNKKLSYDGFDVYGNHYEVKPLNIISSKPLKKKLDGSGSYNDLTWARHRKYLLERPFVLISGFIDGHLAYIFEVPYSIFSSKIEQKLMENLGENDQKFKYLRSFKFTYKDWIEASPKPIFITDIEELKNPRYYNRNFLSFLKNFTSIEQKHFPIIKVVSGVV